MNKRNWVARTALVCSLASLGIGAASAATIQASFLAAGVQTPTGITTNYETFNSHPTGSANGFTTNYNGSSYTGTYTGGITISSANNYGGAGGTGRYPTTTSSYTLALNKGANYFGLWFSALDAGNQLQFYNGSSLLYTFTPQDFINLVGTCPGTAFCGNPNNQKVPNQQFAYLNFYDPNGTFNRIVFSQLATGGFESDNHAVATLTSAPGGTPINPTPEPATLGIMLAGGALVMASRLRRRN